MVKRAASILNIDAKPDERGRADADPDSAGADAAVKTCAQLRSLVVVSESYLIWCDAACDKLGLDHAVNASLKPPFFICQLGYYVVLIAFV